MIRLKVIFYRIFLFTFIVVSSLSVYSCKSGTNKIESELYSCIIETSAKKGNNLEQKLNEYEQLLINANVLENATGQAYFNLYTTLAQGSKVAIPDYNPEFPEMFSFLGCYMKLIQTEGSSETKFMKIWSAMLNANNSSNKTHSKIIIEHLGPNEFGSPFYRMVSLISLYNFTKMGKSLPTQAQKS
ncbi:MAG: hypothetical protein ACPGLV_17585 [Bacteroidia bacterium]